MFGTPQEMKWNEMKGIDETLDFLSSESISKLENAITTFFKWW